MGPIGLVEMITVDIAPRAYPTQNNQQGGDSRIRLAL